MKYLVIDTNVFIHYKDFEQIDWKSLVGDDTTICVTQKVISEIDKHKDQSRGRIQKRAKKISTRFSAIFLQEEVPQINIEVVDNPPATAFNDEQFHKDINDDWIILSALHSAHSKADIIVVSGDNGILMKAKSHGLGYYLMPDALLLAEEPSDEEKEIRQLKQQLAKYESRRPAPRVEFEDETDLLTIIKPTFIDVQKETEKYETELRSSHAYQSTTDEPRNDLTYLMSQTLNLAYSTPGQREEYNKELDEYFKKKLMLKQVQLGKQLMDQRLVKLEFWLGNTGTAALGNSVIFLTFPENVAIYTQNSKVNVRCEDPGEPILKNNLNIYNESLMAIINGNNKHHETYELWDVNKKLDRQELNFSSSELIHGMKCPLENRKEDYYIDIARCGNFTIKWSVRDSELIDPVEGELHVVIKEQKPEEL